MRKVLGLDLSISCTGVAGTLTGTGGSGWAGIIPTTPYRKRKTGEPIQEERNRVAQLHVRISHIAATLKDCYLQGVDLVVMEGLAFDSNDTGRQSAGLAWIVRHQLASLGIPYALVPPTTLKRYATGSGGATKGEIIATVTRWIPGILDDVPVGLRDNAADATVLALMGQHYLDQHVTISSDLRIAALGKCYWPELPAERSPLMASEYLGLAAA